MSDTPAVPGPRTRLITGCFPVLVRTLAEAAWQAIAVVADLRLAS